MITKPINFKFGEYLKDGYNILKNNLGDMILGFLLVILISIIPFCSLMAVGNYYKYIGKLKKGQNVKAGEIFDFKDFMPYFIIQLIIFAGLMVLLIPLGILISLTSGFNELSYGTYMPGFVTPYIMFAYAALFYFIIRGFYIPAMISLKNIEQHT